MDSLPGLGLLAAIHMDSHGDYSAVSDWASSANAPGPSPACSRRRSPQCPRPRTPPAAASTVVPARRRVEDPSSRHTDFHKVPHELQGLLGDMGAVLRIGVTEHPAGIPPGGSPAWGRWSPHHIFALLAETPFLRAAGHLIPYHAAPPDPSAHCKASVMEGYCLQSMNRQTGAPGLQALRASYSHSAIQRIQLL